MGTKYEDKLEGKPSLLDDENEIDEIATKQVAISE